MPKPGQITRQQAIAQVAQQLTEPISTNDFIDRVLAIVPSTAKDPRGGIRSELRYHTGEVGLVYMDDRRSWLASLQVVMRGVRFRHTLSQWEAEQGAMFIDAGLIPFLPGRRFQLEQTIKNELILQNEKGIQLSFTVTSKQITINDPVFGKFTQNLPCLNLMEWFLEHDVAVGDSILFTIESWQPPTWQIEHEASTQRNQAAIDARNQELADIIFEMLEAERDERLYLRDALPAAFLRVAEPTGYPGDSWLEALAEDGRMRYSDMDIQYIDGRGSMFEELSRTILGGDEEDEAIEPPELSAEEANRIYRFKCWLEYNPKLWRRIDILGAQTLAEFSRILVNAFRHDPDHLARFSHLIQRGKSKRYREVEIGTINPFLEEFEEEDNFFDGINGNDIRIADLELAEGNLLQYIFDFGDWHEHRLQLEEILPAAQKVQRVKYPRIIAQNEPEYQYCEECQKKNKQEIATWVCIECSNQRQEYVLICKKCLNRYHREHYAEEMLY